MSTEVADLGLGGATGRVARARAAGGGDRAALVALAGLNFDVDAMT
ncbi:MAG: hypothetical protein R3A52_31600 [Polyangiales bacterium]